MAHIVFVISSLGAGGAERVLSLVANHWVEAGHRVDIIAFDSAQDRVFHDFDPRIGLVRLALPPVRMRMGAPRLLQRAWHLRGVLKELRPDLVISFLYKVNVTTLVAAIGLGLKIAVAERNHPEMQKGHPAWNTLRRLTYPSAAHLILQTEGSRKALPASLRARGIVIANPITAYPRQPEPSGRKHLVAVGRLENQKGFDLLLPAWARVAARHPDWALTIWGEGPLRPRLEAQARALGIADRVSLPGLSKSTAGWIADASAFVLSSRFEGFGNALAEAMAAGLPVVAFDCEFGVEVLVDSETDGLVVPAEDIAALGDAIDRLLSDGALRLRLGDAARVSAARFSVDRILTEWDGFISKAIGF